ETLLARMGRPHALAQATAVRVQAAQALVEWSHALYLAESQNIDRLLERGDLHAAHAAAQRVLERCLAAGDAVYQGEAYDIALAHFHFGRALRLLGAAEAALHPLTQAQQRFEALVAAGDTSASRMASTAIMDRGICLRNLGRLDAAAAAFADVIQRVAHLDDRRHIAVTKGQLGTIRMLQQRYEEALTAYQEVLQFFAAMGEPGSVAVAWHQIGMVYRHLRQF